MTKNKESSKTKFKSNISYKIYHNEFHASKIHLKLLSTLIKYYLKSIGYEIVQVIHRSKIQEYEIRGIEDYYPKTMGGPAFLTGSLHESDILSVKINGIPENFKITINMMNRVFSNPLKTTLIAKSINRRLIQNLSQFIEQRINDMKRTSHIDFSSSLLVKPSFTVGYKKGKFYDSIRFEVILGKNKITMIRLYDNIYEEFFQKPLEEILKTDSSNFSIQNKDIVSIEITSSTVGSNGLRIGIIKIKLKNKIIECDLLGGLTLDMCVHLLKRKFPNRVNFGKIKYDK